MQKLFRNLLMMLTLLAFHAMAYSQNAIVTENALPGNPKSEWDITGAGDLSIQGFATEISINKGSAVSFKITTAAGIGFGIKIYRLGYYNGNGARLIADLGSGFTGINQAPCAVNTSTGEVDCGNWISQSTWTVPATAVSGVYIAKIKRNDNSGASHIIFIVRDDATNSRILFKTSDATWQAYNDYGGNNFYAGTVAAYTQGHATKVSYNRPFYNRKGVFPNTMIPGLTGLFNAEYAMIRWMERNGYDMSYSTCVDMARNSTPITPSNHKILLSVGHDEYWSLEERTKFEAAANAGVSIAFFSGNEVYWKTRWENSIDGSSTPYRTLVCYKEGDRERGCGFKCDPLPNVWTGSWRDGCDYPGADGCKPENKLTGQISWYGTTASIAVPSDYKNFRFWKNTGIASLGSGQSITFPDGTLGHEWDPESSAYASFYPSQRITLSNTLVEGWVHKLSIYKNASGALIFGAGTVQWSWGLDAGHDRGSLPPSPDMQQATINLLGDMGALPQSMQSGMVLPVSSTDAIAPSVTISTPASGTNAVINNVTTIKGTAADPGGAVGGVEISFDGGATWIRVTGTENWSYLWTPQASGTINIKVRAFDDSWNVTSPAAQAQLSVTVISPPTSGVCANNDSLTQFIKGTTGASTSIAIDGNGALILTPSEIQEFEKTSTPPGFTSASWSGSNIPVFNGDIVTLNGCRIYSNTKYPTGTTIEFYAKFSDDSFENIGFCADGNFSGPWAVIGRDQIASKGTLYARSDNGGRELLGTNLTNEYHRYKIRVNSTSIEYFVDGNMVATITEIIPNGVIQISNFNDNAFSLSLDWLRVLPYTFSGTYASEIFDAGSFANWTTIFWNTIEPGATLLTVSVRTGNVPVPDGSWKTFTNVKNGSNIAATGRYIQYNAALSTIDNTATMVLQNIQVSCNFNFPETITELKGTAFGKDVKLEWTTVAEYNNKTFEVQRSINKTDWTTIGTIDGAGNSSSTINYEFFDKGLQPGIYYYRLKLIDNNNKFTFSNTVSITIVGATGFSLEQNFPNPFGGQTTIAYSVPTSTSVKILIFDVQGRLIQIIDEGLKTPGRYIVEIHTGSLSPGIYYYKMDADDFTTTRKMIIQ